MSKQTKSLNKNLWWLDFSILNVNNVNFKFYYFNNIFFIKLTNYKYFCLINKYNVNCIKLYNLDSMLIKNFNKHEMYTSMQTLFFDINMLISITFFKKISSVSSIFFSNSWVERELKEFNFVTFNDLADTRKLLSNYNYNNTTLYNQFNNILTDIIA